MSIDHGELSLLKPRWMIPALAAWLCMGLTAQAQTPSMNTLLATQTTDYHHASISQTKNIELVAKRLNGVMLKPGESFSYYRTVGPYNADNGYHWGRAFSGDRIVPSMGGGVCQGASTLYAALLRTGLEVTERHPHSLTVPYLPAGEDATVAGNYYNFRFRNERDTPIRLTASADSEKRKLKVAIYGVEPPPKIKVCHEILDKRPFRVVHKTTASLPEGTNRVLFPGQAGVTVRTWLEIQTQDGTVRRDLGVDKYRPSPRVIEVGQRTTSAAASH